MRATIVRLSFSTATIAITACCQFFLLRGDLLPAADYLLLGYLVAIGLMFSWVGGLLVLAGGISVAWLLKLAAHTKLALTHIPLTFLDLSIAFNDPYTTLSAADVPPWAQRFIVVAVIALLVLIAVASIWPMLRSYKRSPKHALIAATYTLLLAGAWLLGITQFSRSVGAEVQAVASQGDLALDQWAPWGITKLAGKVGLWPFLIYTRFIEGNDKANLWTSAKTSEAPTDATLSAAVNRYVDMKPKSADQRPNIVMVLMESTFDPNAAFRLTKPVTMDLISRQPETHLYSILQVNAIGAGTWISEFESITGIASKIFGYWGYYTHTSLAPYVNTTIATFLTGRGYSTSSFYPTKGDFYNARNAHYLYGFQSFLDGPEMGLGERWRKSDAEVLAKFIERHKLLHGSDAKPFLSHFVTVENHAPHMCRNFKDASQFVTTFVDTDDFQMNCQLNEYITIMNRTSQGIMMLKSYLESIQQRTGRPYMIVAFGDHQPHTFVSTGGPMLSAHDYRPTRTAVSRSTTMVHIIGTAPKMLKVEMREIPITLIPTIISGYVVDRPEELYLPVNFYLYDFCKTAASGDVLDTRVNIVDRLAVGEPAGRSEAGDERCNKALGAAIADYRRGRVIALP